MSDIYQIYNSINRKFRDQGDGSYVPLIGLADGASNTAFSRLRTSEARLLGDYRYMYGSGTSISMNDLTANGGTLVADQDRNCYLANVTAASGSRVVRQTKKYHEYTSGTSTLGLITFVMNAPKTNLVQAVGMFDDLNGIFFRLNGTTPEIVVRKNGVDVEIVQQQDWNQDDLTQLDFSKIQILSIDYQWLGAGRVRVGFVLDGETVYAHHFYHSNISTEVYMNQPSLPFRWEIYNSAETGTASSLMLVCAAAYCEGSTYDNSFTKSVSTGGAADPISVTGTQGTTGVCVVALRLKTSLLGKPNRSRNVLKAFSLYSTSDSRYRLVVLPDSSKFLNAPTWSNVPGYGWSEYATNINMDADWEADGNFVVLRDDFSPGAGAGLGTVPTQLVTDNPLNSIYQNYSSTDSQVFALIVSRIGTLNTNCRAGLSWLEIK